jgi:hypothetical protein
MRCKVGAICLSAMWQLTDIKVQILAHTSPVKKSNGQVRSQLYDQEKGSHSPLNGPAVVWHTSTMP